MTAPSPRVPEAGGRDRRQDGYGTGVPRPAGTTVDDTQEVVHVSRAAQQPVPSDDGGPSASGGELARWELEVAARATEIASLRALAADVAARADLDLDRVGDIRMAVDEAASALVAGAQGVDGARLTVVLTAGPSGVEVRLTAPVQDGSAPSREGFGWWILSTLLDEVDLDVSDGRATYRLVERREGAPGA